MANPKSLESLEKRLASHQERLQFLEYARLECLKAIRLGQPDALQIWAGDSADLFLQHQQAEAQRNAEEAEARLKVVASWQKELGRKIYDLSATIVIEKLKIARRLHDEMAVENRPLKLSPG